MWPVHFICSHLWVIKMVSHLHPYIQFMAVSSHQLTCEQLC